MMKWTYTLIAGSALILLTNAVVLLGAGYNRSGEAESQLQLTQRELQYATWYAGKDNSGITLRMNWRFEQVSQNGLENALYSGRWGMPVWLDQAKLAELGFEVWKLVEQKENGRRQKEAQAREVLLVLELDGPAYRHQLQRSKEYAAEAEKLLAASPANEEMKRKAQSAAEYYLAEQNKNSRLFVVDAGLDLQKLRAVYPDRARYAIVHGLVRPANVWEKNVIQIWGNVDELHAELIHVPLAYRQVFNNPAEYEVAVAFGQRLEPWITGASGKSKNN